MTIKNALQSLQTGLGQEKNLFHDLIYGFCDRKILSLMGMCNCIAYCCAIAHRAIKIKKESGKKHRQINGFELHKMLQKTVKGTLDVRIPITYLTEYLGEYWQARDGRVKSYKSPPFLRELRELLAGEGFELFKFTPKEKGSTRNVPPLVKIDFPRILLLFETCEELLVSRGWELSEIPKHRGFTMVRLYNAVFSRRNTGLNIRFRRKNHTGETTSDNFSNLFSWGWGMGITPEEREQWQYLLVGLSPESCVNPYVANTS